MKTELRERFRARRRKFNSAHGAAAFPRVRAHLARLLGDIDPDARRPVCAYAALPEEVSLHLAPPWYLPRITGDEMQFFRPAHPGDLVTNALGIDEPDPEHSTPLDLNTPTIACCPAVAVDARGARLGMGKSFYDRFFARHERCLRIGVVYHVQTSKDPLPADAWDQPLDWIVTEKMILRTSKRSLRQWT